MWLCGVSVTNLEKSCLARVFAWPVSFLRGPRAQVERGISILPPVAKTHLPATLPSTYLATSGGQHVTSKRGTGFGVRLKWV